MALKGIHDYIMELSKGLAFKWIEIFVTFLILTDIVVKWYLGQIFHMIFLDENKVFSLFGVETNFFCHKKGI